MVCTFFGHKDTPSSAAKALEQMIEYLITEKQADVFYVGNHGGFDAMVKTQLIKMQQKYPHISVAVVYAYLSNDKGKQETEIDTVYPEGLENAPPRFAIDKRNRWMIKQADYVVTYVKYTVGGAVKYKEIAEKAGKTVFNLA